MQAREDSQVDYPSHTITLDPLRTDGPRALDTQDEPEIRDAHLSELEVLSEDRSHLTTIKRAEDLFDLAQTASPVEPVIPETGKLSRAIFSFHLTNSDTSYKVELVPPHTIHLPCLVNPAPILHWLDNRRYRILAGIAHRATIILLALASAFAPTLGDGDNDEDDCDSDRTHVHARI